MVAAGRGREGGGVAVVRGVVIGGDDGGAVVMVKMVVWWQRLFQVVDDNWNDVRGAHNELGYERLKSPSESESETIREMDIELKTR
ncbi:hypothetical protein Tco_0766015 [Tanacetum coccineum]